MPTKPQWLTFAVTVSDELEKLPPQKSGRRYERHLYSTWLKARNEMAYEGSEKEWDFLVHNYDKVNKLKRPGSRV